MSNTTTLPTIHTNGTSRETLCDCYDNAADKLRDFIQAWEAIEFNARDYYINGPDSWPSARDERDGISAKIREVRQYLDAIRENLHS